jgi:hypothetical protein
MTGFSIIICTYNPDIQLLNRLFKAILNFVDSSPSHEVIIIDNNSDNPLADTLIVKQFLKEKANSYVIRESTPGLTAARIRGIKAAEYDWLIFFDDDNEPSFDYLIQALFLINKYPHVGAWGPGQLKVEYVNQQETIFLKKVKWLFQERNYDGTVFDNNIKEGSEYYPYGTGMIAQKKILSTYSVMVEDGRFTMSDRTGKNLSSAGDIQILFTGIKMGFYAGSSNLLSLNHLITSQKTSRKYINKLVYALNSTQLMAYNEVFPEQSIPSRKIDNMDVIKTLITALRSHKIHQHTFTRHMFIAKKMGELKARVLAYNYSAPFLLSIFENIYLK